MPITSRSTPGESGPRSTRSPTNTARRPPGCAASTGRTLRPLTPYQRDRVNLQQQRRRTPPIARLRVEHLRPAHRHVELLQPGDAVEVMVTSTGTVCPTHARRTTR